MAARHRVAVCVYGAVLVQDNHYWCVPPESPVWWFIEGDDWTGASPMVGRKTGYREPYGMAMA